MDNEKFVGDLLYAHGLKKTPIRTEMLELFMGHDFALSVKDIVTRMTAGFYRYCLPLHIPPVLATYLE